MIRPHPASSEFARRVEARNGRLPAHLDESCRVAKCATPHCRRYAATNDLGSSGPLYCSECWEQHYYVQQYRVTWRTWATLALFLAVVAAMVFVGLSLVPVPKDEPVLEMPK